MATTNINPYGQGSAVLPTTSSPIADNLTTDSAEFALSARQGVVLKEMINQSGGGSADAQPVDQMAWMKACKMRLNAMMGTTWEPVAALSVVNSSGNGITYDAGTVRTGMPYSNTREIDKYIGWNVSFYTFLTAIHNTYSLLYTEKIASSRSQSSYGKTYHGTSSESETYYGIHCSVMVAYILGLPCYWLTRHYPYAAEAKWFENLGTPSADKVKLFDVVWMNGHVKLITDIAYNADGTVSKIYNSESIRSLPRTNEQTSAQFNSQFSNSSFTLFRPKNLGLSTEYEDLSNIKYNDDICTIAGDKASFRKGDTIGINYTIKSGSGYTKMLVKKNGDSVVKTIQNLVANDESSALADHLVDLTNDNLEQGLYAAYLSNADETVLSEHTLFEVIDTSVTVVEIDSHSSEVYFRSSRGLPVYVDYVSSEYHTIVRCLLPEEGRLNGFVTVNYEDYNTQRQKYTYNDSLANVKVKVLFKGLYGTVPSELIQTNINL